MNVMIIVCQKCSTRLQVDESKVPSRPFAVRCPKCNSSIDASSPGSGLEQSAVGVGGSPASGNPRSEPSKPAPLFQGSEVAQPVATSGIAGEQLVELLASLASQTGSALNGPPQRPSWNPRKALLCLTEEHRETVARSLAENSYQVFVAEDTRQAVERMRENQLDVVVLDPRFDTAEQGSAFVTREVNVMRPNQRRRLFFVLLSPTLRTMDAHAAFLNNVNAVVNVNEADDLPSLIEHRVRAFNELYKDFNTAMRLPSI